MVEAIGGDGDATKVEGGDDGKEIGVHEGFAAADVEGGYSAELAGERLGLLKREIMFAEVDEATLAAVVAPVGHVDDGVI